MKKTIYFITTLVILTIVLSACSKDNKDLMQGTWKAKDMSSAEYISGESMTIKGNNIKINKPQSDVVDDVLYKYYNFKDKEQSQIRFYTDKKGSKYYEKNSPDEEGTIEIKDNILIIQDDTGGKYKFEHN